METLTKSIIYGQAVPLDRLLVVKILSQASSAFILNLSKSSNILFG